MQQVLCCPYKSHTYKVAYKMHLLDQVQNKNHRLLSTGRKDSNPTNSKQEGSEKSSKRMRVQFRSRYKSSSSGKESCEALDCGLQLWSESLAISSSSRAVRDPKSTPSWLSPPAPRGDCLRAGLRCPVAARASALRSREPKSPMLLERPSAVTPIRCSVSLRVPRV